MCGGRLLDELLKRKLRGHLLIHSGDKLHKCAECKKSFSKSGTLRRHLLTYYSVVKPRKCVSILKKYLLINPMNKGNEK